MANVLSYALLATISSACLRGLADDSVGLWIAPLVPILCQPGMQGRDPTKVLVNGVTRQSLFTCEFAFHARFVKQGTKGISTEFHVRVCTFGSLLPQRSCEFSYFTRTRPLAHSTFASSASPARPGVYHFSPL